MKRISAILLVLLALVLVAGCGTGLQSQLTPYNPTADLFNYDGLEYGSETVLVRAESLEAIENAVKAKGGSIVQGWTNRNFARIKWALVNVPYGKSVTEYIKALRAQQGVLLAEPNFAYSIPPVEQTATVQRAVPQVEGYELQWAFKNINAEAAWDITTGSPNVIVGVVDTGVDITMPEFAGKIIAPYNATGDGRATDDVEDLNEHGTHVAGIAAANPRNEGAMVAGVAWGCPIMPVRVEDSDGSIYTSYLIEAMIHIGDYMAAHRDKRAVVNMSIGGRGYSFAFKDAIDYAADNGVLLVCSMGNNSKRVPQYPSGYNGVVAVAASTPTDAKASFSTTGWWTSVAAPGVSILSTVPGGYAYLQGTSMATPYVTGAVALLLSKPGNENLSALEIKNQLEQTARGSGFTEELGYGILDVEALLGDIKPMKYGTLNVRTNIDPSVDNTIPLGIVTVYDSIGRMVGWGTTGTHGNYLFRALKPGTYTVIVSHNEPYLGKYATYKKTGVNVPVGQTVEVSFDVQVPTSVSRTSLFTQDYTAQAGEVSIPFTATADGFYEFVTSAIGGLSMDTILTLKKTSTGQVIAMNDDYIGGFSYIGMNLEAGDYTVLLSNYDKTKTFTCRFDINGVTFSF